MRVSKNGSVPHMEVGDHYCGIYRTEDEHRAIVIDFIREGIARREKMLYIVNVHTAAELKNMLESARIDIDALTKTSQLTIVTAKEAYLERGSSTPIG